MGESTWNKHLVKPQGQKIKFHQQSGINFSYTLNDNTELSTYHMKLIQDKKLNYETLLGAPFIIWAGERVQGQGTVLHFKLHT